METVKYLKCKLHYDDNFYLILDSETEISSLEFENEFVELIKNSKDINFENKSLLHQLDPKDVIKYDFVFRFYTKGGIVYHLRIIVVEEDLKND